MLNLTFLWLLLILRLSCHPFLCPPAILQWIKYISLRLSEWVCEVAQSCLTICDPMDCSLPGFSVHGIFQAIVLDWIAISFSRRFSWPRDQTRVSSIVDRRFIFWATREVQLKINDPNYFSLRHMEQKFITALPWIWVLKIYQAKDPFQEFRAMEQGV